MNAFPRHHVGQRDARGLHLHTDFAMVGLGALLLDHLKRVGPAVMSHDDARVLDRSLLQRGGAVPARPAYGARKYARRPVRSMFHLSLPEERVQARRVDPSHLSRRSPTSLGVTRMARFGSFMFSRCVSG